MAWDEEKYDAFVAKMEAEHPDMFAEPYGGFAIGSGWWHIIERLCNEIDHHIKWKNRETVQVAPVVVRQIKEKFGGLRFYYDGGDEYVSGLVTMAENWASRTCEECGETGQQRSGGWIRTLCDVHEAERQAKMKEYDA